MKPLSIVGILLILAGGFVLVRGLSYTSSRDTVSVGPFSATVTEKQTVPTWVGGAALAAGLLLVVAGARSKSRS